MAAPVTPAPETVETLRPPKAHRRRFALLYVGLVALLASGAGIGIHLATRNIPKPVPWSSWVPAAKDPENMVREIAGHVQAGYHDSAGKQLATVRGGPLSVGSDAAVLVKPDATATATGGYKFFDGESVEYQICANTKSGSCAFNPKTTVPNVTGALTRRMAYELALTTFHYVPTVKNVAVLLPAVIKGQKARMLVLSRGDTKDPKSLEAAIVPIRKPGKPTSLEETKIGVLTDPLIFHYEVTATSDNQPVYLITPLTLKDTAAAPAAITGG